MADRFDFGDPWHPDGGGDHDAVFDDLAFIHLLAGLVEDFEA